MSEIFISYKSERKLAAEHFAEVLSRYGYSVWFDYSLVKGKDFSEQIDRQIRQAKAFVVLWCTMSVKSRWVKEEVFLAQKLGMLIPVKIEACDLPIGFQLDDTIDLIQWDGGPRSHQLDSLLDHIEHKVGRPATPNRKAMIEYEAAWRRFGAPPLRAFALGRPIEVDDSQLSRLREKTVTQAPEITMLPPDAKVRRRWLQAKKQNAAIRYEDPAQRLVRSFAGHPSLVRSVAFSPDGHFALSGGRDNTLKLWETSTGKCLRSFAGHANTVRSIAFSPDGRFALSGSSDKTLKLWEAGTGKELRSFSGHSERVRSVAFSPDGRFALSGSEDNTLRLWDVSEWTKAK